MTKKTSPFKPKMTSTPESFPKTSGMILNISRVEWKVQAMGDILLNNITDDNNDIIEDKTAMERMELKTDTSKEDTIEDKTATAGMELATDTTNIS